MAADLLENFQYGLSSSGLSGADKTVLFLKLTDPSLKCIEQYQKLKYSSSKRPSIQFKGNSGVITFPSTEAKDGAREFKFTVQPIQAPPTSSFESIQHYRNSRGEHKLDSLGNIQTKVTVSGTDDVYQTTHKKMKLADEEMKKVSTKIVKQEQFKPGRRVKRKSISAHAKKIISSSSAAASSSTSTSSTNHPSVSSNSMLYSSTSTTSSSTNASTSATAMSTTLGSRGPQTSLSTLSSSTASKSAIAGSSSSRSSGAKPSGGASTKGNSSALSSQKSAVHNRSYRDRVIHILAVRPYKKPELLLKLQKDGIPSKEKNQLANILTQVATLAKDNSYILNKNMYNEVSVDWPAYSDTDKQLVKRKKTDLFGKESPSPPSQRSPHHATSNSTLVAKSSPSRHVSTKTSSPASQKRPLLPEVKDYTKTKKARIAHNPAGRPQDSHPQLSPSGGFAPAAPSSKKAPSPISGFVPASSNSKKLPSPSRGYAPAPSSNSKKVPSPKKVASPASTVNKKVPSPVGLFKKVPSPSSSSNALPSAPSNALPSAPSTTTINSPSSTHQSALSSPSVSTTRNSPDCCDGSSVSVTTASSSSFSSSNANKHSNSNSGKEQSGAVSGRTEKQAKTPAVSVKEDKRQIGKESPSGDVSSTSVVPEYLMKFTTIRSMEQRHKYKEEFNNLYPKYHDLHKYIEGIKSKFKSLQEELNQTPKDSKNYEKLQDKVIEEYNKTSQDPGYSVKEARWRELHDLLGHIKNLIMVYDNERLQMNTA